MLKLYHFTVPSVLNPGALLHGLVLAGTRKRALTFLQNDDRMWRSEDVRMVTPSVPADGGVVKFWPGKKP